jgi:hypothetical protein
MATWPASLPYPALNTLKETPPENTIRTQMEKGPAKLRRRTTANVRPLSFTLKLTPAQVTTLDDFFTTTTFSGAVEFTYTHPRTGASVTARFTEPPTYSEVGGAIYNAAVALEILP